MQLFKENKEWNAQPNNHNRVNDENTDMYQKSENCGEPWKNHEDEIYITNKELELV